MISIEQFFSLFLKELESHQTLWHYYKFHSDPGSFEFRKAYFHQRLEYIADAITKKDSITWDVGCGYGTTAIFLALNGYRIHGTTLEFYYKFLPERMKYWSQFGDVSGFTFDYENLFDEHSSQGVYDYIIVQDTLHHLEPIHDALNILQKHIKPDGKMIVIEENGSNLIQSLKLYKQRGNKRVIEIYDERLKKNILLGNENIRSLKEWEKTFQGKFQVLPGSVEYVRALPPFLFNRYGYEKAIEREQRLWKKNNFLRDYFYFGINFIAVPQPSFSNYTS